MTKTYLDWVAENTETEWWHDSADRVELDVGLARGAAGVTTNPVLISAVVQKNPALWRAEIDKIGARNLPPEQKAEALMRSVVATVAQKLAPRFEASDGQSGWVCAQVNPARASQRECMAPMAQRFHTWASNIAVKLPATAAGLDVLEDCVAAGITVTATVSFTVPQVIAIAERHRAGAARAHAKGVTPGRCFAVLMIGRLDDYLREVAHDQAPGIRPQAPEIRSLASGIGPEGSAVLESDIRQAGLAVVKRAYALYRERAYEAKLLIAALRGSYHLTELAGASLVMSIHPTYQEAFVTRDFARETRSDEPIPPEVIARLRQIPDFVRAYEPDGMTPTEFITFGLTQRTLSQFTEVGWKELERC